MALTAQQIITRAARTLNDSDHARWTEAELLEYLSDAQRAAVLVRPEVNPVTATHQLVAGSKQALPDDGFVLIECVRNMGEDGATPGRAITPVERATLDQTEPSWHVDDADAAAVNFIYDIRNRRTFYVYPIQPDPPHQVEIVYARIPGEIEATGAEIEVDDIYQPALLAYILHRAHIKDVAVEGQGLDRASRYFDWFMALLLGKAEEQDVDLTIRHETAEGKPRAQQDQR